MNRGTCLLWEKGPEKYGAEDIRPSRVTEETAGYIEADLVNCSTCDHYSDGKCLLWQGKVKPGQCCDVWENNSESLDSKIKRIAKLSFKNKEK